MADLSVFYDRTLSAQGNPCRVVTGTPKSSGCLEESEVPTRCFLESRTGPDTIVSCFSANGREINCCGHGMLAAAYLLHNNTGKTQGLIHSGAVQIPWHACRELHWIRLPSITVTPTQTPPWLTELFGDATPLAAATAGGDSDYLVVQWPDGFDLSQLPAPGMLAKYTQRALIATCESRYSHHLAHIESRYFAPQYGVAEDLGTGSAMRVLALYWQQRGLGTQLSNYQRSTSGSLLFSEITDARHVNVGGRIAPMDRSSV
ncbi:MAG: PhzF family phenazine biosynthesis protein [Halioglobus sp.]